MKHVLKIMILGVTSTMLCACNGFFDKDNTPNPTPLAKFTPEANAQRLWRAHLNFGVGDDYLKLVPALNDQTIYTADKAGEVVATDKFNGKTRWRKRTGLHLSAGPAADNNMVVIGGRTGAVIALRESDGAMLWQTQAPSEILAPPAVKEGYVVVKTIDGQLTALSETDGHVLWHYQQVEPNLILRSGSAPKIQDGSVVSGFANGNLAKLTLSGGNLIWQTTVGIPQGTFAVQRMVDIDADPMIYRNQVYAATYQGRVASLEYTTGKDTWTHDISSFTGLNVDPERVYVSDAVSDVWAFDRSSGQVDWRLTQLEHRNITGPALLGNYIIVGDSEGYIHWINKQDGHFVSRTRLWGSGILATPVVDDNQIVYVLTRDGYLAAFKLV